MIEWVPKIPDEDDPSKGWYKCENCGELGFDDPWCPKCGEGAKERIASLESDLVAERERVRELEQTIAPALQYLESCGDQGCDHAVSFCTPEHSMAVSFREVLARRVTEGNDEFMQDSSN